MFFKKMLKFILSITVLLLIFFENTGVSYCGEPVETPACPFEVNDHLILPRTAWAVDLMVSSCGATDEDRMEIVANNKSQKRSIILAQFGMGAKINLENYEDEILVFAPNLVDLTVVTNSFDKFHVRYIFQPKDDPLEREHYRFWLRHPDDPEAVKWFEGLIKGHE